MSAFARSRLRWTSAVVLFLFAVLAPVAAFADWLEVRRAANVYTEPDRQSSLQLRLDPADYRPPLLVNLLDGEKVNGYYHIQLPGSSEAGWIYKTYVRRIDSSRESSVVADTSRTTAFTSSTGRRYKVTPAPESPDDESYSDLSEDDMFTGNDRKDAKTSIPDRSTANVKAQTLEALLASLKPDEYMRKEYRPKLTRQSKRVAEENVIVKVRTFLFAIKKEDDNDFHLILSTDPAKGGIQYLTAEITGIPEEGPDKERLIKPRRAFKQYFSNKLPGKKYEKYDPPVPVEITGPLFFDIDHAAGVVGPAGHRPKTAWEIHPVMDIKFLQ